MNAVDLNCVCVCMFLLLNSLFPPVLISTTTDYYCLLLFFHHFYSPRSLNACALTVCVDSVFFPPNGLTVRVIPSFFNLGCPGECSRAAWCVVVLAPTGVAGTTTVVDRAWRSTDWGFAVWRHLSLPVKLRCCTPLPYCVLDILPVVTVATVSTCIQERFALSLPIFKASETTWRVFKTGPCNELEILSIHRLNHENTIKSMTIYLPLESLENSDGERAMFQNTWKIVMVREQWFRIRAFDVPCVILCRSFTCTVSCICSVASPHLPYSIVLPYTYCRGELQGVHRTVMIVFLPYRTVALCTVQFWACCGTVPLVHLPCRSYLYSPFV